MATKWTYRVVQYANVILHHTNLAYVVQQAESRSRRGTQPLTIVEASTDDKTFAPIGAFRGGSPASILE